MKKTYTLGNETFTRKTDIAARARAIKDNIPWGTRLTGDDLAFVRDLLTWHPRADEKIGAGVASITVGPNLLGEAHFIILRTDRTSESFSYRKCVSPPSRRTEVIGAFRDAISNQTIAVKTEAFYGRATVLCPVTNRPITFDEAQVDHQPPTTFRALIERFVSERELDIETVELATKKGDHIGRVLVDARLRTDWQDFHRKHAHLRVVSAEANLRIIPKHDLVLRTL